MQATEVRQRTEQVSAGDREITLALDALDEKLQAWLAAVADSQQVIADLCAQAGVAEALPDQGQALPESDPAAAAEPEAATSDAPELPEQGIQASAEPTAEQDAAEDVATSGSGLLTRPARRRTTDTGAGDGDASAERQETSEDDEALLASLDPETAHMIRVKRRLMNNSRSVRELLAELQESETPKDKRRKRWWR